MLQSKILTAVLMNNKNIDRNEYITSGIKFKTHGKNLFYVLTFIFLYIFTMAEYFYMQNLMYFIYIYIYRDICHHINNI